MDPVGAPRELPPSTPRWLESAFSLLASVGIAALCVVVTVTVVSRWLYEPLIPDDVLVVREIMVGVILLPLATLTARRGHIVVTIFTRRLRRRGQLWLSALGHAVGFLLFCALLWAGARFLENAIRTGDFHDGELDIPMWIGRAVFVVALGVCAIRTLYMAAADLIGALRAADEYDGTAAGEGA